MKKILLFLFMLMNCLPVMPVVIKTGSYSPEFISDGGSFDLSDDDLTRLNSKLLSSVVYLAGEGCLGNYGENIPVDVSEEEFRTLLSLSRDEENLDRYEVNQLPRLLSSADYLGIQNEEVLRILARKFLEKIRNISWKNIDEHLVFLGNFFENKICSRLLQSTLCGHIKPVEVRRLADQIYRIYVASWSPSGTKVLTGAGRRVKIWDAVTGACLHTLSGHTNYINSVSWSPNGTKVLTGSMDNTARIWDGVTGKCLQILSGNARSISSVRWSPDGTKVLTLSLDNTVKMWDALTGLPLQMLSGCRDRIRLVGWFSDGTKVLTVSDDGRMAKICNAGMEICLQTLFGDSGCIDLTSWSPDGTRVLTGSPDNRAMIWDAVSGRYLQALSGHTGWIRSVSWSPDGTKVLTAAEDRTTKVWDTVTGVCLQTLSGGFDWIKSVSWSPEATKALVLSNYGAVKILDLTGGLTSVIQQLFVLKSMQSGFDVRCRDCTGSVLRRLYSSLPRVIRKDIRRKTAEI